MDTIKAFVNANKNLQQMEYRDELKQEIEFRQCTIEHAELQAHPQGYKQY